MTYRSMHLFVLVLFCLGAAHLAGAHVVPLLHTLADDLRMPLP